MREFERRKKRRKILSSKWVLVPMFILFLFLARGTWNLYLKDRMSVSELQSAKEKLTKLQSRQEALVIATKKLSTESGIETEIRDKFAMVKMGEKEIVIVDKNNDNELKPTEHRTLLQKIWDFFTIR